MKNFARIASVYILFCMFCFENAFAQEFSTNNFYLESHAGIQGSFGPSSSQAEIAGGYDSISYDKKKHLVPGFRSGFPAELVFGLQKNKFQFQSTISYFKQDIGLVERISYQEFRFCIADLLSIKISSHLKLFNNEKPGMNGLYTGFFISTMFPVASQLNDATQLNFGFHKLAPAAQFNWGTDFSYVLGIGTKGWYVITGAAVTMPGILGSIAKMEMENNSSYSIIRDRIKMYSMNVSVGIGLRLINGKDKERSL